MPAPNLNTRKPLTAKRGWLAWPGNGPPRPPPLPIPSHCGEARHHLPGCLTLNEADMETDAESYGWQATFRNWSVTSQFIPLPVLRRRLLARWPNLDPAPVLRAIE